MLFFLFANCDDLASEDRDKRRGTGVIQRYIEPVVTETEVRDGEPLSGNVFRCCHSDETCSFSSSSSNGVVFLLLLGLGFIIIFPRQRILVWSSAEFGLEEPSWARAEAGGGMVEQCHCC